MAESILDETKVALGLEVTNSDFDAELIRHINAVLAELNQIGAGQVAGFAIVDNADTWQMFYGEDPRWAIVKSYVYDEVGLLFDPPQIGFVLTMKKEQLERYAWRISVLADTIQAEQAATTV